jgi:hypothetical protein
VLIAVFLFPAEALQKEPVCDKTGDGSSNSTGYLKIINTPHLAVFRFIFLGKTSSDLLFLGE